MEIQVWSWNLRPGIRNVYIKILKVTCLGEKSVKVNSHIVENNVASLNEKEGPLGLCLEK